MIAHAVGCGDDDSSGASGGASSDGADDTGRGTTDSSGVETGATLAGSSEAANDSDGSGSDGDATTTEAADSSGSSDTGDVLCEPSPPSIEGPFYRPGMPVRSDLDIYADPGLPVRMSGRVLDSACEPVANAVVEIWHASPIPPDTEPDAFDATYDDTREYRYYGQVATDANGHYEFETLKPGWYLNGLQYRPAHIHVKIWTGDDERLTTQLYFVDDPFAADDPWFDETMTLALNDAGEVEFDFTI